MPVEFTKKLVDASYLESKNFFRKVLRNNNYA